MITILITINPGKHFVQSNFIKGNRDNNEQKNKSKTIQTLQAYPLKIKEREMIPQLQKHKA